MWDINDEPPPSNSPKSAEKGKKPLDQVSPTKKVSLDPIPHKPKVSKKSRHPYHSNPSVIKGKSLLSLPQPIGIPLPLIFKNS